MVPAQGWMQQFANRLFISRKTADLARAINSLRSAVPSIRTVPELLEHFTQTLAEAIGSDAIVILLQRKGNYTQCFPVPVERHGPTVVEQGTSLATHFLESNDPVISEELDRRRLTPQAESLLHQLGAVHATAAAAIRTREGAEGIVLLGRRLSGRIYGPAERFCTNWVSSRLLSGWPNGFWAEKRLTINV